jgi:hypothetical protein
MQLGHLQRADLFCISESVLFDPFGSVHGQQKRGYPFASWGVFSGHSDPIFLDRPVGLAFLRFGVRSDTNRLGLCLGATTGDALTHAGR